jgi:hypothetical protein
MLPFALALCLFAVPLGGPTQTRQQWRGRYPGENALITESGTVVRRNRDD